MQSNSFNLRNSLDKLYEEAEWQIAEKEREESIKKWIEIPTIPSEKSLEFTMMGKRSRPLDENPLTIPSSKRKKLKVDEDIEEEKVVKSPWNQENCSNENEFNFADLQDLE